MSLLIERFVAQKNVSKPGVAQEEIVRCVKMLRRRLGLRAVAPGSLEPFLALRNIRDVTTDDTLKTDGALVPLGRDFRAGFRLVLRRDLPESRINFTVAHEICHTFFYERVPEIKFEAHPADPQEERLCNFGAEEMLMPGLDENSVRGRFTDHLAEGPATFIIDDDDQGESADVVSIEETTDTVIVYLWHCKFCRRRDTGGAR